MRRVWAWGRELVWLAIVAIACVVGAVVAYAVTGDAVWPFIFSMAGVTFAILSLRDA